MRKSFGILITMALLTAACATGAVNPGTTPTTTTRNLGAPASMAFALQPFDACEPLLEYVKEHALDMVGPYGLGNGYWGGGPWMAGELAMEDSASPATATAATRNSALQAGVDYSTTNVQEIGVDEPDIVKTDGNRILAIAQGVLYYVDVSGDKPNLLGSLRLDDSWAQEMLLAGDTLLVMSRTNQWDVPVRLAPEIWNQDLPYYGSGISVLSEIDISDPSDMQGD